MKSHSDKNTKKPKLRFPGFTGEWEEKRLGDVAEINPKTQKLPEEFIYIDLESVESGKLLKENEISSDNAPSRAQRVLRKDDILFQMVRPYQRNNLYFDLKDENKKYVASTGYAQLRPKDQPKFIYHYMHTNRFVNEVLDKCTGTSYPAINSSDLGAIKIGYPTLTEQKRIAEFLSDIDTKIEKLTRKKELTEHYKKGAMQKIFSQKIRFKDEKGKNYPDWEEKKLGDVCTNISSGKTKPTEFGDYPVYGSTGIIGKSNFYTHSRKCILIARVGANAGKINLVTGNYCVTDNTLIIENKDIIDTDFLNEALSYANLNNLIFGSGQPLITAGQLKKIVIAVPCFEEQKKISDFLIDLDTRIEHINKKLAMLKEFEKGLLQGMFE